MKHLQRCKGLRTFSYRMHIYSSVAKEYNTHSESDIHMTKKINDLTNFFVFCYHMLSKVIIGHQLNA